MNSEDWQDIILIIKKVDKENTGNYRSVRLINSMAKVFLFVIKNRIISCLDVQ